MVAFQILAQLAKHDNLLASLSARPRFSRCVAGVCAYWRAENAEGCASASIASLNSGPDVYFEFLIKHPAAADEYVRSDASRWPSAKC